MPISGSGIRRNYSLELAHSYTGSITHCQLLIHRANIHQGQHIVVHHQRSHNPCSTGIARLPEARYIQRCLGIYLKSESENLWPDTTSFDALTVNATSICSIETVTMFTTRYSGRCSNDLCTGIAENKNPIVLGEHNGGNSSAPFKQSGKP